MLRKHFDNEIIELSNNLEDVWASIIKKYEISYLTRNRKGGACRSSKTKYYR